ncbi:MAG: LysR family transcriptional regulator [Nocardioides sp.]|nr:LysR family transcriptional regulator [Nocardioides sp.]
MSVSSFTLVQLRYFAAAVEYGSMTAAARELMVSQSAVSTAIAQLEKELGVQLLLRQHARGLVPTAAGHDFYQELHRFLGHAAELEETARNAGGAMVGRLSVGCFSTLAPFHLPSLLTEFERRYPEVRVQINEAEHAQLKQALRDGTCELALMYGYDLDEDIDRIMVADAVPYVIVSAQHRLAHRKRVWLTDLADDPMVLLDLPHTTAYFTSLMASVGVQPRVRFRSSGYETVRALVAHGHGFALLNQRPHEETTYDGERAVVLELRDKLPPLEVVVTWMRGIRLTRRAQAFITMAGQQRHGRQ